MNETLLPRLSANEAQAFTQIAHHGSNLRIRLPAVKPAGTEVASGQTDNGEGADHPVDADQRAERAAMAWTAETGYPDPATGWDVDIARGANPGVAAAADRTLAVHWWGARWRLDLPSDAYSAWLDARLPDLSPGPLPRELAEAADEVLLEEIVAILARQPGGAPSYCREATEAAALPYAFTVAVRSQATGTTAFAILSTDALGLMLLAGMLGRHEPDPMELNEDALPLILRATLGTTHLSVTETGRLQPHDVVFIDDYRVDQDGEFWLSATPTHGLRAKREGSSYVVTQGWTSLVSDNFPSAPGDDLATASFDLEQIPVILSFDLGERGMTLSELRRLAPGEVFDLQRPIASGPVTIRANGTHYASGTLVEVEGRVGVMIAAINAPRS